jgi:hypothetical protein
MIVIKSVVPFAIRTKEEEVTREHLQFVCTGSCVHRRTFITLVITETERFSQLVQMLKWMLLEHMLLQNPESRAGFRVVGAPGKIKCGGPYQ